MSHTREITDLLEDVSLGAPENAVGFVLWRVMHRYQRELDRALARIELTHLQFTTLVLTAWLSREGEPATQSELARFGDIHPMQVSHMLRALEAKTLISRSQNTRNSLAKNVEITPAGLSALREAIPVAIDVQRRLFGQEGMPGGKLLAALLRVEKR